MPIRPIDLQTMLMQLSQVGREQSAEKEGVALTSAMKNAANQKRLDETKESVHRAEDADTGARAVDDREGRPPPEGEGKAKEGSQTGQEKAGSEVITDPELGTKIDLSG